MLVSAIVVNNQMQIEIGRRMGVDRPEELDELLVPVLVHAPSDHAPIQQVEGGEQRREKSDLLTVFPGP
jgi:hypothetical protein